MEYFKEVEFYYRRGKRFLDEISKYKIISLSDLHKLFLRYQLDYDSFLESFDDITGESKNSYDVIYLDEDYEGFTYRYLRNGKIEILGIYKDS